MKPDQKKRAILERIAAHVSDQDNLTYHDDTGYHDNSGSGFFPDYEPPTEDSKAESKKDEE
jgi:hypothetical protein